MILVVKLTVALGPIGEYLVTDTVGEWQYFLERKP